MSTPQAHTARGDNNWLTVLGTLTPITALAGIILLSTNWDPTDPDRNVAAIYLGSALITAAGALLAGGLVAGAICWQLRHR